MCDVHYAVLAHSANAMFGVRHPRADRQLDKRLSSQLMVTAERTHFPRYAGPTGGAWVRATRRPCRCAPTWRRGSRTRSSATQSCATTPGRRSRAALLQIDDPRRLRRICIDASYFDERIYPRKCLGIYDALFRDNVVDLSLDATLKLDA